MKRLIVRATIGIMQKPSNSLLRRIEHSLEQAARTIDKRVIRANVASQVFDDGDGNYRVAVNLSVPGESWNKVEAWADKLKCGRGRL